MYHFGARDYDPFTGTWLTQDSYRGNQYDPMSQHRYLYNNASPINYLDPYGLEPNQNQVGSTEYWVAWVAQEEAKLGDNPTSKERRKVLSNITNQSLADARKFETIPYGLSTPAEDFNNRKTNFGRYLYSQAYGGKNPKSHYIDAPHFFDAANKTSLPFMPGFLVEAGGILVVEGGQLITRHQSFLSPEDLPSNQAGVAFGEYVDLNYPIAPQLEKFLRENAKAFSSNNNKNQCLLPPYYGELPPIDEREFDFIGTIRENFFYNSK